MHPYARTPSQESIFPYRPGYAFEDPILSGDYTYALDLAPSLPSPTDSDPSIPDQRLAVIGPSRLAPAVAPHPITYHHGWSTC